MKKLKNKKVLLIAIPVLVLLVGLAIGGSVILMNEDKNKSKNEVKEEKPKELTEDVINATELKLKENYEVEFGTNLEEIDWLEFVENKDELTEEDKAKFNGLSFEAVDTSKAGEYEYVLKYDNKVHTGKITVKEEEKKEEPKEEKKESASSGTPNNTPASKPSNTPASKPSSNSSGSSSNGSSGGNNTPAPAPTPTPEPTPAITCPPVKSGTNSSVNGFTVTSDGNCGGTISYAGHSAGVKWTCDAHGCDAKLTNNGGSNSNIMVVGGDTGKSVGVYLPANTTYNTPEQMNAIGGALFSSKQEFENKYRVNISKLSYQVKDTTNVYEADNVYGRMASFINQVLDSGKTFVKYNTMDYNFRVNGFILLIGTPLNNGLAGPDEYSWEQYFVTEKDYQ